MRHDKVPLKAALIESARGWIGSVRQIIALGGKQEDAELERAPRFAGRNHLAHLFQTFKGLAGGAFARVAEDFEIAGTQTDPPGIGLLRLGGQGQGKRAERNEQQYAALPQPVHRGKCANSARRR